MKPNTESFVSSIVESLECRRLFAAGAPDNSFSQDGKASIPVPAGFTRIDADDVAVQADGKTVVVGRVQKSITSGSFLVARFNLDGSLDSTFGPAGSGVVRTNVGNKGDSGASAVAIQPDGRIVVAGSAEMDRTLAFDGTDFAVVRYHPNGTLDTSFDGDGKRTIHLDENSEVFDVLVQGDKILLCGDRTNGLSFDTKFAVARLNANGSLDKTYGNFVLPSAAARTGIASADLGGDQFITSAAFGVSGQLVIVGSQFDGGNGNKYFIARLTADGRLDQTFNGTGSVRARFPGFPSALAESVVVQSSGKIVIGGIALNADLSDRIIALTRFNANGSIDTSFGSDGNGVTFTEFDGRHDCNGMVQTVDGGLVVLGKRGGPDKVVLSKYTSDGVPDGAFGVGGKVLTDIVTDSIEMGIARGPGRRITITGAADFLTARYLDAGANLVTAGTFGPSISEQGPRSSSFFVTRTDRLPTPLRVFFSVTGTATRPPTGGPFLPPQHDYIVTNMVMQLRDGTPVAFPYVDIPANQTFTSVTITPIDDARVEGNETAIFTILSSTAYDIATPSSARFTIADNDGTTLGTTADAFVRDGANANTNFGGGQDIQVKSSSAGFNRQSFIKFDLSSVSVINSAKLKLFGALSSNEGAGLVTQVFGAGSNWSETGLTFNNRTGLTTGALASATILDSTQRAYELDVTSFLRAEKLAGRNIVTLVFINSTSSSASANFASRESGNGPQLVIG